MRADRLRHLVCGKLRASTLYFSKPALPPLFPLNEAILESWLGFGNRPKAVDTKGPLHCEARRFTVVVTVLQSCFVSAGGVTATAVGSDMLRQRGRR
jgi:hypothetical protein